MSTLGATRVARRYALALLNTAARLDCVEAVRRDLEALTAARRQSPAFQRVVDSPLVSLDDKRRILREALRDAEELTRRFVDLLVVKRRVDLLPAVFEEYVRSADEARGIARVYVTSAAPLSDDDRARIASVMRRRLGRDVHLIVRVEPALLGGVTVRVGDTVWDGSVRGALEVMRERMVRESSLAA